MSRLIVAGADEFAAVATLVAAFRDHLRAERPTDAEIEHTLPLLLDDADIEFCCAFGSGGEPLGYTQTRFFLSIWDAGRAAHLEDLYLVESARGTGLGRALLEHALSRARGRNAKSMSLNTNEQNEAAQRLYRKAGFRLQTEAIWSGGRETCWVRPL